MNSRARLLFASAALAVVSLAQAAVADPVRINAANWVGFAPLFVAQEKGFFRRHGVEVDLSTIDSAQEFYPLLIEGKLDMSAGAVGTAILYLKHVDDLQYVTLLDDSYGGDGIIARKEIHTLGDLKGKSIAVNKAASSEFYLNALLRQAGFSEKDLTVIDMTPGDAGKAFLAGRVDAAVTWEPYLSQAKQTDFGHLLIDSTTTPGLVSDVLMARKPFVIEHGGEVKAVVTAWNEAVAYVGEHPTEANAIMARNLRGSMKDPAVFADTMQTVRLYGAEDSRNMFGTAQQPGPIYATVKEAIEIWSSLGRVTVKVAPEDIMNYQFVAD
jgi:NitT/TauT family transport system substrate-binding protein